jgi:hypothetical protein
MLDFTPCADIFHLILLAFLVIYVSRLVLLASLSRFSSTPCSDIFHLILLAFSVILATTLKLSTLFQCLHYFT